MMSAPELRQLSVMPETSYSEATESLLHDPYRYGSHRTDHQQHTQASFDSSMMHNHQFDYAPSVVTGVPDVAYNPWILEFPHYDSPTSRSPSLSDSDVTSTPPPYCEVQPVYHLLDHSLPLNQYGLINHPGCVVGSDQGSPQSSQEDNCVWRAHLPVPSWDGQGVPATAIQSTAGYVPTFHMDPQQTTLPSVQEYLTDLQSTIPVDSVIGSESETDSESSDCEDEDSFSDHDQSTIRRSSAHTKPRDPASVLKLGRWSTVVDACIHPEQRQWLCPFSTRLDPSGRKCSKRFVRPEHLRRHIKTVHGTARDYVCKVPTCGRAFSRGDNLRDHYWTHISRGGRAGKNHKMSLAELKEILGPKEKKLVKRLKARLLRQRVKCKSKL